MPSAQLIAAVILAGLVAVALLGRRRARASIGSVDKSRLLGTGQLYATRLGQAMWCCDLCGDYSPHSNSRRVLRSWAHHHTAQHHPEHAHIR